MVIRETGYEAPYQSGRLCSSSSQKINAVEHKPRPSSPSPPPSQLSSIFHLLPRGICTFPPESAVAASEITRGRAADLAPFLLCGLASSGRNKELLPEINPLSRKSLTSACRCMMGHHLDIGLFHADDSQEPTGVSPRSNIPVAFFNGIKGASGRSQPAHGGSHAWRSRSSC